MLRSRRCSPMQVEDLRLHGDVEGGGRLVGEQQRRAAGQGDGDHHALAHAAGQLVRVLVEPALGLGDADVVEQLRRRSAVASLRLMSEVDARSGSVICLPIFITGFSEVIGSWKIIAISRAPDVAHLLAAAGRRSPGPRSATEPVADRRCASGSRPMIERTARSCPSRDSPTMPSVLPRSSVKLHAVDGPDEAARRCGT